MGDYVLFLSLDIKFKLKLKLRGYRDRAPLSRQSQISTAGGSDV